MTIVAAAGFAVGALGGHRVRTALSLLGVAIGVTAVVLLTSLGEGARLYVVSEFTALGTNLVIVTPGRTETTGAMPAIGGTARDLTLDDVEALRRVPGVRRVAPLGQGQARARAGERSRDVFVSGSVRDWQQVRRITLARGSFLPGDIDDRRRLCVIGAKLPGELFPGRNPLGAMLRVGDERYRVIGIMAPRGTSLGIDLDEVILIPVAEQMRMFNVSGLSRILVEVTGHEAIAPVSAAVTRALRARHGGREDFTILTQDSVIASFGSILAMLTAALAGIAAISLAVAGIGIMNVMLVSVTERTREIGLLKAVGATPRQVLLVFLIEATVLAVAGGAVGLVLAAVASAVLRAAYPAFPVQAPAWAVASALAVSLVVGLVFGTWPARRASRLDPIVALARR